MIYPFYYRIKPQLMEGKDVLYRRSKEIIESIRESGYVTRAQFSQYTNLMYDLPTIITPEVMLEAERYKKVLQLPEEEMMNIPEKDYPHPERSYQRNLVNLIIGYYAAKESFYKSFARLNPSRHKKEIIEEIALMDLDDIFVKFSGFHKISSVEDKTITTSDIKGIEIFSEYLNRGWNLDIIPGLVYDRFLDKLVEMDFKWEYVNRYLNDELNKYNGKGRVRIKYNDHLSIK